MSATKKTAAFLILVLFTFSTPGCLDDLVDDTELYQGETSTVTMEIVHAESAANATMTYTCLLYTSPSPRDRQKSRMPSSA